MSSEHPGLIVGCQGEMGAGPHCPLASAHCRCTVSCRNGHVTACERWAAIAEVGQNQKMDLCQWLCLYVEQGRAEPDFILANVRGSLPSYFWLFFPGSVCLWRPTAGTAEGKRGTGTPSEQSHCILSMDNSSWLWTFSLSFSSCLSGPNDSSSLTGHRIVTFSKDLGRHSLQERVSKWRCWLDVSRGVCTPRGAV